MMAYRSGGTEKKVAGATYYVGDYCRYSVKEDDKQESNSIISQREINRAFIAELGKQYPDDRFIHVDSYQEM